MCITHICQIEIRINFPMDVFFFIKYQGFFWFQFTRIQHVLSPQSLASDSRTDGPQESIHTPPKCRHGASLGITISMLKQLQQIRFYDEI